MASSKKISALTAATVMLGTALILAVQGGSTVAIPGSLIQPPGIMAPYAAASAPSGWLLCNGQAVSRSTYADLYTAIGTTWGVGDGSTTFNLPDLREAAPIGAGTYSAVTGTTHGAITAHDARALGAFADDQGQGHHHNNVRGISSLASGSGQAALDASSVFVGSDMVGDPSTDGTNGTPRTGTVTRGKTIGVNYIIKY